VDGKGGRADDNEPDPITTTLRRLKKT
jgi:hypothetical protein